MYMKGKEYKNSHIPTPKSQQLSILDQAGPICTDFHLFPRPNLETGTTPLYLSRRILIQRIIYHNRTLG